MPKTHPAFIIDRSKQNSKHATDFVVCTDTEVGFVAKAYKVNREQYAIHNSLIDAMSESDANCKYCTQNFGNVAIVLEVVHLLYPPISDRGRLKSLLKKALKAYIHSEVQHVTGNGSDIDRQIAVVSEMLELSRSQYDNLVLNNSLDAADCIISNLAGAIESLKTLKIVLGQTSMTKEI